MAKRPTIDGDRRQGQSPLHDLTAAGANRESYLRPFVAAQGDVERWHWPLTITCGREVFQDPLARERHGNAGSFSFAAGHAEIKKFIEPRTVIPVREQEYGHMRFKLSPGNPDLAWLQERSSYKVTD